ncbi:hypothetical protein HGG72_23875 [Ochrobactrum pecoris]|uniref:Uncharacterized protein n=1 Tax=Brucella pecoris TaxID=867683 RepID=A0A5C5CD66_9HYPH|nr:hypothetical protein [Brucella pecoris]MBB4095553.1 hypothetical protein [Brucella pecoris]NKW81223.1 hypothetical protein [Brucella pecoris]NKW82638.1 hypothetical protein [Brucella pecoris]TNV09267.1 hypothetical protein FIB18_21150 [Brucella pecoris]
MEFSRDIADAAKGLWLEIAQTSGETATLEAIALALLKERQRCATIALCVFDDDEWSDDFRIAGGLVAEAILEDGKS